MNVVLSLLIFVLLSLLIEWGQRRLVRRWPVLAASPGFYFGLAAVALSVWLPWPALDSPLAIPAHLLEAGSWQWQAWTAQPEHPQLQPVAAWHLADVLRGLLLGMALVSVWRVWLVVRGYVRLTRWVESATELPSPLTDWPSHVRCKVFEQAHSAFACGFWRQTVMVPSYVLTLPLAQQQLVLRHELTHLARGDAWGLLVWQLLGAVAWFNPVLARWQRAWQQAVELQVDQAVCRDMPEEPNDAQGRAVLYAKTMLWCLSVNQGHRQPHVLGWTSDMTHYQQRLTALFQPALPLGRGQHAALVSVLVLSSLLLALGCSQLRQPAAEIHWRSPVAANTPISSPFGEVHAIRQHKPHLGIDFAGARGAPIYAPARGVVVLADAHSLNANYGQAVLLEHGQGYQTLYAHLERSIVSAGERVEAGQIIGYIGQSGKATGPHLHFEWLRHGVQQDPTTMLNRTEQP